MQRCSSACGAAAYFWVLRRAAKSVWDRGMSAPAGSAAASSGAAPSLWALKRAARGSCDRGRSSPA